MVNVMAKPLKQEARFAAGSSSTSASERAVATFDLDNSRCYVIPVDAVTRRGTNSAAPADDNGSQVVGEFEHAGRRYRVLERAIAKNRSVLRPVQADPTRFLTTRELQIVRLVCFGNVNKQIAYQLKISEYTVKTYLKQIFMKLHVRNRSAVVFQCAAWVGGCGDGIDAQNAPPHR